MMLGLGATTPAPTGTTTTSPGFTDGLSIWKSPSAGFTAIQTVFENSSQAFQSNNLPVTAGILAPPIALIVLLMTMGGKK